MTFPELRFIVSMAIPGLDQTLETTTAWEKRCKHTVILPLAGFSVLESVPSQVLAHLVKGFKRSRSDQATARMHSALSHNSIKSPLVVSHEERNTTEY